MKLVAGVGGLADQAGVVRGLAALHLPDDHATAVPRSVALRVLKQAEHVIRHVIQAPRYRWRHAALHPIAVGGPEPPFDAGTAGVEPWAVVRVVVNEHARVADEHAYVRLESSPQLGDVTWSPSAVAAATATSAASSRFSWVGVWYLWRIVSAS